ncbi:MAG: hypothetical protein ACRDOU_23500 [Streptosporangiaceae bacterium]
MNEYEYEYDSAFPAIVEAIASPGLRQMRAFPGAGSDAQSSLPRN